MPFERVFQKLTPKKLSLIDAFGAVMTAFSLGVILINFSTALGLPKHLFNLLALIACCFAIFSVLSHLLIKKKWRPYLISMATFNMLYCCLTLGLLLYYVGRVKLAAWIYFIGEIILVGTIAFIEFRLAQSIDKK